jgi:hypothetical protein
MTSSVIAPVIPPRPRRAPGTPGKPGTLPMPCPEPGQDPARHRRQDPCAALRAAPSPNASVHPPSTTPGCRCRPRCSQGGTLPDGAECYRAEVAGDPDPEFPDAGPAPVDELLPVVISVEPDGDTWHALFCPRRKMVLGPLSSGHARRLQERFQLVPDEGGVRHLRRPGAGRSPGQPPTAACGRPVPGEPAPLTRRGGQMAASATKTGRGPTCTPAGTGARCAASAWCRSFPRQKTMPRPRGRQHRHRLARRQGSSRGPVLRWAADCG